MPEPKEAAPSPSPTTFKEAVRARDAAAAVALLLPMAPAAAAAALMESPPRFGQILLGDLPAEVREAVLAAAPPEQALQWRRNAAYDEKAVGRMMEPVLGAFPPDRTVGEAIEALRDLVKKVLVTYIWVVDGKDRLLGVVTMRDLLFRGKEERLGEVMLRDPFVLHAEMPAEEAMKTVLDRHYPVYPAVDVEGRLVGLVRGHTMFVAQAVDITLQAGSMVGLDDEERLGTPWKRAFRMRHPWLQLNLLTAFLAAAVVGAFQGTIDRLVILALFLPVLAGQSGNTGCQALAVTLRGMTLGELKPGTQRSLVRKEAWLGMLNGAGVGVAAALGMFVIATGQENPSALVLSFVVFVAMILSCVASGVSGAMVPLTLKKLGFDPATASSIFLTTATDVVSMGALLGLATLLVRGGSV